MSKVKFLVKLYVIITQRIKKTNPYKKGLKRLFRNLFPVYEKHTKVIKTVECDFLELQETQKKIVVDGVQYAKVYRPTKSGKEPLYIQETDIFELSRGNYYPYMRCSE